MNLLLASLFNLRRYRSSYRRVFVVLDTQTGIDTADVFRWTRPWHSWMTITGLMNADRIGVGSVMITPDAQTADIVLCISGDDAFQTIVRAACLRAGNTCVDPTTPPKDSRELGLLQEVLHHDFELGGVNEWTGEDPQYSASVVRMLSATHCQLAFPAYVGRHLGELWQQNGGVPLQALDVGCGAISRLRWGALSGLLTITGVDPLLDMYAIVRERHGYASLPEIRCTREICAGAEDLGTRIAPGTFDFAYCANALDHTEDPGAVIASVAAVLRPGGLFAVDVYTREGSRENWWQLHQFDMYLDAAGEFMAESRDGVARRLVPPGTGLVIRDVAATNAATTALVLQRVVDDSLKKTA